MRGERVFTDGRDGPAPESLKPGQYMRYKGEWYACTPNDMIACLSKHSVIEHSDGSITVWPSILVTGGTSDKQWHGYLERGRFSEMAERN